VCTPKLGELPVKKFSLSVVRLYYVPLFSIAVNQGHCHPRIVKALKDQVDQFTLSSRYHSTLLQVATHKKKKHFFISIGTMVAVVKIQIQIQCQIFPIWPFFETIC